MEGVTIHIPSDNYSPKTKEPPVNTTQILPVAQPSQFLVAHPSQFPVAQQPASSGNTTSKGLSKTSSKNDDTYILIAFVICLAFIILYMASSLAAALYNLYNYYNGTAIIKGSECKVDNAVTTVCNDGKCKKFACKNGTCIPVETFESVRQNKCMCSTCMHKRNDKNNHGDYN